MQWHHDGATLRVFRGDVTRLPTLNLHDAERQLCEEALARAGSVVEAAQLLGITRHALKRRMIKHRIEWPPADARRAGAVA